MGKRGKRAQRCIRCRLHIERCICEHIPAINTRARLVLVSHFRELSKPTATGNLALESLINSELKVHGEKETPLNLTELHNEGRRVMVLFPSEKARVLSPALLAEDPRPVTLVVPDGNWRQATRIPKRVPGLPEAEHVVLPKGAPSRWGVRKEPKLEGLATFEAIARAFSILESEKIGASLMELFQRLAEATLAARGTPRKAATTIVPSKPLPIIFQDKFLVAVNKPSGQMVHPGWARDGMSAMAQLRDQLGQFVYPVHRIDRATSGVVLFALSSEMAADMHRLFAAREVHKKYLALCRGNKQDLGVVEHPLASDASDVKKEAITRFEKLGHYNRFGLYAAYPKTGRQHQVRRHLKHLSHPIIGDVRYGKGEHNRHFREHFDFHRLALHHRRMRFVHPRSGTELTIQADLPCDFESLLTKLVLLDVIK